MTIGELQRAFDSRARTEKKRLQETATFVYTLGELTGRSIARVYSSSNKYPEISDVFPTLFDSQEILEKRQEQKAELSALRFKQFAQLYNSKFKAKEEAKET